MSGMLLGAASLGAASLPVLGGGAALYLVVCTALCGLAYRRGGGRLAASTAAAAVAAALLFVLGYAVLVAGLWRPEALRTGLESLSPTLRATLAAGLSVYVRGKVLVLERPQALLLISLIPWLWPALSATLTDMSRRQLALQLIVRSLLLVVLSAALSQPSLLGERKKLSVVALVDVSDSMAESQLASARAAIEALRKGVQPRGDDLHVVTFGGRPRLLALPPQGEPLPPLRPVVPDGKAGPDVDRAATNIQAALQLAYGLHAPGTLRRVLLFTDGNQTEGDALAEAQAARARGVRIGFVPLAAERPPEVLVRELRLLGSDEGAELKVGAPLSLEAEIYSSTTQRARVTLLADGVENPGDGHRDIDLVPGKNLIRFRAEPRSAGYVTYRAQLGAVPAEAGSAAGAPLRDGFAGNNQAVLSLAVKGKPRVLYIEGEPQAKGYLSQALARENIDVEVRNAYGMPHSAKELLPYDLVLVSDVPATLVGQAQMLAIEGYVKDYGGGFIMAGGENSFGSGGYQGTQIEKLLPVRFEQEKKRDQPSLGLVLCIDRSGSMNGPKLELAKDAARATAEMLGADDLIGVVAFDSQATPLVRLQRAQNRVRIQSDISRLQAGGGTQLLPPLQEAYQQLVSATAKIKHVILLTDGQAEYQGIIDLVDQMVQNKITVSTVGVGSGADQTLLTAIAEHGGGRFYFTQDASSIPKIFTKETTQVARSALVEERIRPVVAKYVELLDGVGIEGAPPLRGYVATKPKPMAEVILVSPQGEPLLVRWRQGLGQAVAFTSDVKNRWAVDWLRWPGYAKFWAQLTRSSMRHDVRSRGQSYDLVARSAPPFATVRVDAVGSDDRFVSGMQTELEVIAPQLGLPGLAGQKGEVVLRAPMPLSAPGRYETEVRLPRTGAFLLRAVHRAPGPTPNTPGPVVAESWGSLALSYPREYLALPPDLGLLQQVATLTGGARHEAATEVLSVGDETTRFLRALWPYLVWAALGLMLLDVLLRRVRMLGFRPLSM
ncbi:MAG: VWA domain-containing protein [Polyangia bacterium]